MLNGKSFDFPKMHILLVHSIEDLVRKGPLRHGNTILGERCHTKFKRDFKRTDGRHFEPQASSQFLSLTKDTDGHSKMLNLQTKRTIISRVKEEVEGSSHLLNDTWLEERENRLGAQVKPDQHIQSAAMIANQEFTFKVQTCAHSRLQIGGCETKGREGIH